MTSPWNLPDEESDGRHFVFVYGYNVNSAAAREWADAMFKRLWWSGSKSMFTAVDWRGDDSQFATLTHGDVSPDYYANVMHAFASASALASRVASLPGTEKVLLAHSLGNLVVSSAIKDHGLSGYSKYYMLNAAVPMEAYYTAAEAVEMTDSAWLNVPVNYRASDWNCLFSSNDFRASLSWRGRFAGIPNAVNCYSETENVLANPTTHGVGGAWSMQELFKGTSIWNALNVIPFLGLDVACEGGWGINTYHALNPMVYTPGYGFFSNAVVGITREDAITHPLFTPFREEADNMHSTNMFIIADANYGRNLRAKFLGDAIPAHSFAVGRNPMWNGCVIGNITLSAGDSTYWPVERVENGQCKWLHSDIKDIAFFYVNLIFQKIKSGETQ